jgi:uncharacterized protein YbbC (DUF1343 family)
MPVSYRIVTTLLLSLLSLPVSLRAAPVKTGADVLADNDFPQLRGKKFGLVTNRSATVGGIHLLDVMTSAGIRPVVIFTPEHGLNGKMEDGVLLSDESEAGIPVKSLYGATKKPRREDLMGLDVVVFDMQDVGARFYTYISTMGLAMQAAAEAGIPFMLLDRPNPLGGDYVAGFVRNNMPASFTSLYPIPIAHGMTTGELALMIRGEGMLPGLEGLDLTVVEMTGWRRWMRWPDTGLAWVPTSPNLAGFYSSFLYAGICLLEGTAASEGRGTNEPFRVAGWPGIDADMLAVKLNHKGLPGVRFTPVRFTPVSIPGTSSLPKYKDKMVNGIRIEITDYSNALPVETGVAVITALYEALPLQERKTFFCEGIDDLAGSVQLRLATARGETAERITRLWDNDVFEFMLKRRKYLLYSDR